MMNPFKTKKGLGRGLSSLIGDSKVEKNINKLADEFTLGEIIINPIKKNETCRNCGYSTLCRIGESASEENSREKQVD